MQTLPRLRTYGALTTALICWALPLAAIKAGAEGGTTVALDTYLRRCDFSRVDIAPKVPNTMLGTASAQIQTTGSRVIAQVRLYDEPHPGTHFEVGLIQMPRPSGTCGPGDPGTAFTGMDTDAAGNGTATVQDSIRSGTTGVWVIIERLNGNSQNPAEFYTSEFLAPV